MTTTRRGFLRTVGVFGTLASLGLLGQGCRRLEERIGDLAFGPEDAPFRPPTGTAIDEVAHLLHRLSFGPRLGDRSAVELAGADAWIASQLAPASIDDTVAVLEWLADAPAALGGRAASVTVAGDSAGGALAALAALRTRGSAAAPDRLVTAYANTDLAAADATMVDLAHGFGLDAADVAWFNEQWVPDRTRWADPDVSPLHEPDLAGLCPATIVTCELDPLRSQGEAFAHRLVDAGVPVTIRREPGMVHNFLLWDLQSPACAAAGDRFADDLARRGESIRR